VLGAGRRRDMLHLHLLLAAPTAPSAMPSAQSSTAASTCMPRSMPSTCRCATCATTT
jgi:hypothetical protein